MQESEKQPDNRRAAIKPGRKHAGNFFGYQRGISPGPVVNNDMGLDILFDPFAHNIYLDGKDEVKATACCIQFSN